MATGAVSSQQMPSANPSTADAITAAKQRLAQQQAAAATAGQVIQSGVTIGSTLEGLVNGKTYFHRIPGARSVLPDGREIQFLGGQFSTSDPRIIAELDAVANSHTSMIFTEKAGVEYAKSVEGQLASAAGDTVGDNQG